MKKLHKLQINSDKLMKNEELITLKGGYDGTCLCMCIPGGTLVSESGDCGPDCYYAYGTTAGYCM